MEPTYNNCRQRRHGTKTENQNREKVQVTNTGDQDRIPRLRMEKKEKKKVYPVSDVVSPLKKSEKKFTGLPK